MSRVYDAIEPTVIDDELLHECVYDQGPTGEAGSIVQREGIDFRDVSQLRLDFRSKKHVETDSRGRNKVQRYSKNRQHLDVHRPNETSIG